MCKCYIKIIQIINKIVMTGHGHEYKIIEELPNKLIIEEVYGWRFKLKKIHGRYYYKYISYGGIYPTYIYDILTIVRTHQY